MDKFKLVGDRYMYHCPGCCNCHGPNTTWGFNGDYEKPTLTPSVKVTGGNIDGPTVCHHYITDGNIVFLSDCTHHLAGQTVPLEPL